MSWKCPICLRPTTIDFIEVAKKKYHQHCFQCERCKDYLAGRQYVILAGFSYCEDCANIESPHGSIYQGGGYGDVTLNFEGKDKYTEITVSSMVCGHCGKKLNKISFVKAKKGKKLFCTEDCRAKSEELRMTRAANHPTRNVYEQKVKQPENKKPPPPIPQKTQPVPKPQPPSPQVQYHPPPQRYDPPKHQPTVIPKLEKATPPPVKVVQPPPVKVVQQPPVKVVQPPPVKVVQPPQVLIRNDPPPPKPQPIIIPKLEPKVEKPTPPPAQPKPVVQPKYIPPVQQVSPKPELRQIKVAKQNIPRNEPVQVEFQPVVNAPVQYYGGGEAQMIRKESRAIRPMTLASESTVDKLEGISGGNVTEGRDGIKSGIGKTVSFCSGCGTKCEGISFCPNCGNQVAKS
eukprot:TRINITY_DN17904_c0_g1_i1.p1 TRINITY_DN17904_c0_g1~~TRINITY_DN17904_c0_g1_i1.p1  ORF type:complete len:401 (+),score=82.08 TRINITY_DN17904_c0_g1_i1:88-1290(+)